MVIAASILPVALLAATLNIEVQQPVEESKAVEIIAWLSATADDLKLVYGRFPNPDAKVIVIPSTANSWSSDSPIVFGRVTRRYGEKVELFINPDRPIEEFYADWTATHEFSHLMLPLLWPQNRWISEGFASYYQNILMARAGRYTPEIAWQRLLEGFERGRESQPDLSPNQAAASGFREARMKIYWSGAAIALLADTQLRRRSEGTESLDKVLGHLQACCLPSRRQWSGKRLFRKLDSFLDSAVFMPLYERYANARGYPEMAPLLHELGVSKNDEGTVNLSNSAPLAGTRTAISGKR